MTETVEYVSNCEYKVMELKKSSKTFINTWKIINFRDIVEESQKSCNTVGNYLLYEFTSSDLNNEGTISWTVEIHLLYGRDSTYFGIELNVKSGRELLHCDYLELNISIINKQKEEKPVSHKRFNRWPYCFGFIERRELLCEGGEFLPDNNLTLIFKISLIKCEWLYNNINLVNPSNMLKFTALDSMFNNQKFSDVKIAIGDKVFYLHKVILAARSPVFAAMFEHDMKENNDNVVEITDIDHKIMHEMLYFIYTGKISSSIEDVVYDLCYAADKYEIEELKLMCEKTLIKQLKVENVITLLIFAEKYRANLLKESALQFFKFHAKEIVQTEMFKTEADSFSHLMPDIIKSLS